MSAPAMSASLLRRLYAVTFALLLLTIGGCATNKAFEDGRQALMAGEQDRALSLFEQAARQSPDGVARTLDVVA